MIDLRRAKQTGLQTCDYNAEFREIIEREFPNLEGRQSPETRIFWEGGDTTHAEKAIKLASRFGIKLMPWQADEVRLALSVGSDGKWAHSDIILLCPRQNGKSLILEAIILYRLFVMSHQIVFSAHQWRTAKSIRNRLFKRIKSKPWAMRRLVRNTASAGEAEMETSEGGKIQFTTRSNDMGRGFDRIDLLMADEAYNLDSGEMDAVAPTQLAADDPQTFFTSSAVNEAKHPKGEVLSRMRERALSGEDETVLFSEYRAPDGLELDDPESWKLANPSYGVVATQKKVKSIRSKLSDDGFEVEMLGWGRWFQKTSESDDFVPIIDLEDWDKCAVDAPHGGNTCFSAEVSPDAELASMVVALGSEESVYVSLGPAREFDRGKLVDSIARNVDQYDPVAVVIDPTGPNSTLVDPLVAHGIEPESPSGGQTSQAYELFLAMFREGKIRHDGNPRWREALLVMEERSRNGRYRAIDRFSGDVGCFIAASLAVWGLLKFTPQELKATDVHSKKKYVGSAVTSRVKQASLSMSF